MQFSSCLQFVVCLLLILIDDDFFCVDVDSDYAVVLGTLLVESWRCEVALLVVGDSRLYLLITFRRIRRFLSLSRLNHLPTYSRALNRSFIIDLCTPISIFFFYWAVACHFLSVCDIGHVRVDA